MVHHLEMKQNLHDETKRLLCEADLSLSEISKKCDVSTRWLSYFAGGSGENYSVTKVQRVHDFLKQEESEAA
jgi:transcriptional regulator with XRE-family HTH domain